MNAQFETLPRFSSIKEVEEWEEHLRTRTEIMACKRGKRPKAR